MAERPTVLCHNAHYRELITCPLGDTLTLGGHTTEQRFADLIKWSFTFWVGSTLTLVGALVVFLRFSR